MVTVDDVNAYVQATASATAHNQPQQPTHLGSLGQERSESQSSSQTVVSNHNDNSKGQASHAGKMTTQGSQDPEKAAAAAAAKEDVTSQRPSMRHNDSIKVEPDMLNATSRQKEREREPSSARDQRIAQQTRKNSIHNSKRGGGGGGGGGNKSRKQKAAEANRSARFASNGGGDDDRGGARARASLAWAFVKEKLRNPSHPSTTSDSAVGETDTTGGASSMRFSSAGGYPHRPGNGRRKASGAATNSSAGGGRGYSGSAADYDDVAGNGASAEPVSHVVVESDLGQLIPPTKSDNGSAMTPGDHGGFAADNAEAEKGGNAAQGGDGDGNGGRISAAAGSDSHPSWVQRLAASGRNHTDNSSIRRDRRSNWIKRSWMWEFIVERSWPAVKHFCDSSFPEPRKEASYQKELFFTLRRGAIASSCFFVVAWLLTTILLPKPYKTIDITGYIAIAGLFIVPLPVYTVLDMGRHHTLIYQCLLWCATWTYPFVVIVDMYRCGFYTSHRQCGSKDFLGLFYWSIALPVLAMLALGQKRLFHIIGIMIWVIMVSIMILAVASPALMYRNLINFVLFHCFLLMTSYLREKSDRQMFALRMQLKLQYRATQAAQVAERKASDSKKRFVSYIFHEVRVPLNTALLAVQNLAGEHFFEKCVDEQQREMVDGLMGSLTMMEKVLNDVLSFNRMESGKFTQARKPFDFHKSVQIVILSHRSQAIASDLELSADCDPAVDQLGGIFIGDEMRIRQVMSNLVSNAIKFTPSGSVKIVTKLLYPRIESSALSVTESPAMERTEDTIVLDESEVTTTSGKPIPLSHESLRKIPSDEKHKRSAVDAFVGAPPRPLDSKAILRVEVHDTGVGLNKKDVVDQRLFSAYVQTEIGRRQGGKGSGLGLALCLQIIKSLKGRLGVESKVGEGSMFWFEIALTLPPPGSNTKREPLSTLPPQPLSRAYSDDRPPAVEHFDHAYKSGHAPSSPARPALSSPPASPRPEPHHAGSSRPLLAEDTPGVSSDVTSPGAESLYSPILNLPTAAQAENMLDAIDNHVHQRVAEDLDRPREDFPPTRPDTVYEESETSTVFRKGSEASEVFASVMPRSASRPSPLIPQPASTAEKLHCLVVDDDK